MVTIASLLKESGCDVSFVCYELGDFFLDRLRQRGIQVSWILQKGIIKRLFLFRSFIRKGNYDVVVSFLETPNILNCFAAVGGRKWRVITGERSSIKDNLMSMRGRIIAILLKNQADSLICNSYNAAHMWEQVFPKLKNKISVIYNICSVQKKTYSINRINGITKIVVAASYREIKNIENVIKALCLLSKDERARLRIFWYGNRFFRGSIYDQSNDFINRYELGDTIRLFPETPFIEEEMSKADYIALFSFYEGLPNAICEAMTLGKPVIMTPVSDYRFLVKDNGFICEGVDALSISKVLRKAINVRDEEIDSMGRESKRIAEKLFAKEVILEKWLNEINS